MDVNYTQYLFQLQLFMYNASFFERNERIKIAWLAFEQLPPAVGYLSIN